MPSPSRAAGGRSRVAAGHRESDGAAALDGLLDGWPFHLRDRQNLLPLKPLGSNGANMAPFQEAWRHRAMTKTDVQTMTYGDTTYWVAPLLYLALVFVLVRGPFLAPDIALSSCRNFATLT